MRTSAKYIVLALLSLLILASNALAQGNTELRVDGERIKSYIAYLSTDEFMGRQSMTPQYQEAAEWVAAQYEAWGLEPAGDNGTYFQRVPISRSLTWYTGIPAVSINGMPQSLDEGDFSINSVSTPATAVDAEVVFVGYGISAPAKGLDEYAGVDVRGKVALVLTGSPKDAPAIGGGGSMGPAPRSEPEPQEEWTAESTAMAKIRTAFDKGADAILVYNPDAAAQAASGQRISGPSEPRGAVFTHPGLPGFHHHGSDLPDHHEARLPGVRPWLHDPAERHSGRHQVRHGPVDGHGGDGPTERL
jgi:hypothetical protein